MRRLSTLRRLSTRGIVLSLVLSSSVAAAQGIRYQEGPGIKLSDSLVFHPGIAMEGRYDTNVLFTDRSLKGAPYLRMIGHLHLATLSPQRLADGEGKVAPEKVAFRLRSAVSYREYLDNADSVANQRGVEVEAGVMLRLKPTEYFAFTLADTFARGVTARNFSVPTSAAAAALPSSTIARDINRAAATISLAPGGGRLLFDLSYGLIFDVFEQISLASKYAQEISLATRYKILPMTAVTLDVVQQFHHYYADPVAGAAMNVDSAPIRIMAGIAGMVTPKVTAVLKAGYGNGIYKTGSSFNSVLAAAEFAYRINRVSRAALGYQRTFDDSTFANHVADHRAYLSYDHVVVDRLIVHLSTDFRNRKYNGFEAIVAASPGAVTGVKANLLTLGASVDYPIQEWLYVGVGYDLQFQDMDVAPVTASVTFLGLNDATRHQVFGKFGVSY